MRIKGARAALAGWEPDILGLSMRWPFCQMMSRPDPQSSELGPQEQKQRSSQILWWGMCVWAVNLTFSCCWWSAEGNEAVAHYQVCRCVLCV